MTPWEVFAITFPDFGVKQGELTVISWILPQTQSTNADNRKEVILPSHGPGTADYVKSNYKFDGYGCGLCQTKVPCESKIPEKKDAEAVDV